MISCLLSKNSDPRNSYSLGDNIGYTDWQTAGAEGNINLFCPDSSIVTGYEGRSGFWLDKYRLICKHLNSDGTRGNISYTDYNGGSEGGVEFGPYILNGNQGLVGFNAGVSTWYTLYLASIQGFGQDIQNIGNENENSSNFSSLQPWVGNEIMDIGTVWVPNGSVIVGMQCPSQDGYVNGVRWIYRDLVLNAGPEIEGDVNNDGIVNLIDILIIVNMILTFSDYDIFADVNGDSEISVIDVISLLSIILGT